MGVWDEKKYKCKFCNSTKDVTFQRKREHSLVYKCNHCSKYFTVKFDTLNRKTILNDHLYGLSFSKIATKYNISKGNAWNICNTGLNNLPDNNKLTFKYCSRFSNIHIPDGKYIHIKGYQRKIPLLWGIDYTTHDIPVFLLAPSENFQSWGKYFELFRIINHYPILIICDDNTALKTAARLKFPKAKIQTCYNHFKESIRRDLRVRTDITYKGFSLGIDRILSKKRSERDLNGQLQKLYERNQNNLVCVKIIADIERNKEDFLAFTGVKCAPATNNMIECYGSPFKRN